MRLTQTLGPIPVGMACAIGLAGARTVSAAELDVRAMSFNIRMSQAADGPNNWTERRPLVGEVIRRAQSDVVGLQEAWPDQIEALRADLPEYELLGRSRDVDPRQGEAAPLLYRHGRWRLDPHRHGTFWLSNSPETPGSTTWWNICPRIVTWARLVEKSSGKAVYVYNTHLSHLSPLARAAGARILARQIAGRDCPDPVIVTGDLNAGEASGPLRYLTGRVDGSPVSLIDTFRAVHADATHVCTYHGFQGRRDGRKIDFVLASGEAETAGAGILYYSRDGRYPSDHYPVVARMKFP